MASFEDMESFEGLVQKATEILTSGNQGDDIKALYAVSYALLALATAIKEK